MGGPSRRTTGNLGLEKAPELLGFYSIAFKNVVFNKYAQPRQWKDPDQILTGWYGDAFKQQEPKRAPLTAE